MGDDLVFHHARQHLRRVFEVLRQVGPLFHNPGGDGRELVFGDDPFRRQLAEQHVPAPAVMLAFFLLFVLGEQFGDGVGLFLGDDLVFHHVRQQPGRVIQSFQGGGFRLQPVDDGRNLFLGDESPLRQFPQFPFGFGFHLGGEGVRLFLGHHPVGH